MNLIDKVLAGVAGFLALGLCIVFFINAELRAALAEAQSHETACRLANGDMAAAVARQNAALEHWRAPIPSSAESRTYLHTARRIELTRAGHNACADTEKLLNQALAK